MSAVTKTVCPTPRIFGVIDAVVVKRGEPVDTMLPQRVAKIGSRGTGTGMRRARAVGGARAPKLRELPSIVPVRLPPPRWTCQALRTANFCPLKMNADNLLSFHGYKEIVEDPGSCGVGLESASIVLVRWLRLTLGRNG